MASQLIKCHAVNCYMWGGRGSCQSYMWGVGGKAWGAVVGVGSVSGSLKLTHLSFHDNVFMESTKVHTYVHNDWHVAVYFWQK